MITPKYVIKSIALCCVLLISTKDFAVVNIDSVYGHDILLAHEHTGYSDELMQEYALSDDADITKAEDSDGKIIYSVTVYNILSTIKQSKLINIMHFVAI